jgi:hypothetical protein
LRRVASICKAYGGFGSAAKADLLMVLRARR